MPKPDTVRLADVASFQNSNVDKKTTPGEVPVRLCNYLDVYENQRIHAALPFMQASATKAEIERFQLRKGDVIITKDSETPDDIGVSAIVEDDLPGVVCGYHLTILRAGPRIRPTYLHYALQTSAVQRYFEKHAKGATRFSLGRDAIANTPIPLPELTKQDSLVSLLGAVDAVIAAEQAMEAHVSAVHDGILGRLYDEGNLTRVGALASYVGSGATPRGGREVYATEGVLFIRSQNVQFEGLGLVDASFIDAVTDETLARSRLQAEDVLLNITGASIGRCCVFRGYSGPANVNQHVCAIRLAAPNQQDSTFLAKAISAPAGQAQIRQLNTGGNRDGLNYDNVRRLNVPWPDVNRRRALAELLSSCDAARTVARAHIGFLQMLKAGILGQFDGGCTA